MDFIELGYLGLFMGCFLSATLIPFPSEFILVGLFELGYTPVPVVLIATLGNLGGSFTNYFIGSYANYEKLSRKFNMNEERLARWKKRLDRWGLWLGLLAWTPFIGDPMVGVLGFFKVPLLGLTVTMFIGKLLRYIVVALLYDSLI